MIMQSIKKLHIKYTVGFFFNLVYSGLLAIILYYKATTVGQLGGGGGGVCPVDSTLYLALASPFTY